MPTGQFIVAEIKSHEPIENADRIVYSEIHGEIVIISKAENPIGTRGILIDTESKIFPEVLSRLNMYSKPEYNEDKTQKGYIKTDGRIRPIRLKKIKCTSLFLSFEQLEPIVGVIGLDNGIQANRINGVDICEKYVRKYQRQNGANLGGGSNRKKNEVPLFKEHFSTDHFGRVSDHYKDGDQIIITVKQHGTSLRVSQLPINQEIKWYQRLFNITPKTKYGFIVGSRRVVKAIDETENTKAGSFFDENIWTIAAAQFKGKLQPGESIFAEIVGYTPSGVPIQPSHSTDKLKSMLDPKDYQEYVANYGTHADMRYGCPEKEHKVFVYRMTLTNEQGTVVDYSWDKMAVRCEQMGVETVPLLDRGFIGPKEENGDISYIGRNYIGSFKDVVNSLANATYCEAFPDTLREGVVVRTDRGGETPFFSKAKSLAHKVLESIYKDKADYVDIEEEQSILENEH